MDNEKILQEYLSLKNLVKAMLEAQQDYFKSGKDLMKLRKSKAIEQQVRDKVYPPKIDNQAQLDFLAR